MDVSSQIHVLAALSPKKEPAGTNWIGGWEGLRATFKKKTPKLHKLSASVIKKKDNKMFSSEQRNSLKQNDQPKKYKILVFILYLFWD